MCQHSISWIIRNRKIIQARKTSGCPSRMIPRRFISSCQQCGPDHISAHLSDVSWRSVRGSSGCGPMSATTPISAHVSWHIGGSTENSKAAVACPPPHFGTPLAGFVAHRELHRKRKWLRSHVATPSHLVTPLTGFVAHREPHQRLKWLGSHGASAILACPSHVSCVAQRELHRRLTWMRPHVATPSTSAHPSHVFWLIGDFTGCSGGCGRMLAPPISAHPSHVSWPIGSSSENSEAAVACPPPPSRHTPHWFRGP